MRQVFLGLLCLLSMPTLSQGIDHAPAPTQPNLLFILADDMGWMDSSPYGSKYYQTPGLERLAAMGMTFTRAYAASPVCSPTRLSLMTGKYPARLKMTNPSGHLPPVEDMKLMPQWAVHFEQAITPESARFMPPEEYTLGEAFRDAGYTTGFVGKWHLGLNPEHWPEAQGFDYVFHAAPDHGPYSYFSPYLFEAGTVTDGPRGEYLTERTTTEAINFIRRAKDGPWMLALWHWAVHTPLQAPQDLVAKYSALQDPRGQQHNPVMAAMLESMDTSINAVLDVLDELGLTDNTIVVFFSDNGGNMYGSPADHSGPPTNNYPLRGGKGTIYDGGTRVPAIIVWPGVVEEGSVSDALISSIDLYPTMLEMAGIAPKQQHVVDGISLTGTLKTNEPPARDAIFSHFPHYARVTRSRPATYVIQGDWKYIRFYDSDGPDGYEPAALYNLREDIGERNNLWQDLPDRAAAMDALIARHLEHVGAIIPVPNPSYIEGSFNPLVDPPIELWVPGEGCDIRRESGMLRVTSVNRSRNFISNDQVAVAAPATLSFRVKVKSGTTMELQGSNAADGTWQKRIEVTADASWREYSVEITGLDSLQALRIYPASTPRSYVSGHPRSESLFDWIRISDRDGNLVKSWEFDG